MYFYHDFFKYNPIINFGSYFYLLICQLLFFDKTLYYLDKFRTLKLLKKTKKKERRKYRHVI